MVFSAGDSTKYDVGRIEQETFRLKKAESSPSILLPKDKK
jgi:hypothetical protein